ncbi:PREDICTED: uncharacterized protein LOC109161269 [Ipomoea nil]|uniref:uncharacterized protein LOC109161269 n=1 Tax=Ipomoea nil TaxID=35883 RepID=UPI00090112C3|nr:PREDICTED: uncharacterized protein LOC109161269 [Ipomoea nil]
MACINMFNNDQQSLCTSMGPRISFSNDFADSQHPKRHDHSYKEAPVSSDFEFSVPTYNIISADEVFFKGKILPLKEKSSTKTLRDELLQAADDDDYGDLFLKGTSSRWRERLGLKRSPVFPKKLADRNDEGRLEGIDEVKVQDLINIAGGK